MSGKVVALHRKPQKGTMEVVETLSAVAGKGFVGDVSYGRRIRQALLLASATLEEFGYSAGTLKEQITVDFPELQELSPGTRLRIGSVSLEIESPCAPCSGMAKKLGETPSEFKARLDGKRGMLAKVVSNGEIRIGDEVEIIND